MTLRSVTIYPPATTKILRGLSTRSPGLSRREAELVVIRRMLGDELFEPANGE